MNRNLVVGGVVFGLILAALSVGVSTFLVDRNIQAAKLEMQKTASTTTGTGTASDPATGTAGQGSDPQAPVASFLLADGGQASNFSAVGYVWSKGQLLVTDPNEDTRYIFSVDTTDGVRVYDDNGLTVDRTLTVNSNALMSDIDASGGIAAGGLITASSFTNAGGFAVGTDGAVQASRLTVKGASALEGNVSMGGNLILGANALFNIGSEVGTSPRVAWNPRPKGGSMGEFVVVGRVSANEFRSNTGSLVLKGDVVVDSIALSSNVGTWSADGTLTTKKIVTDSLSVAGGKFVVDGTQAKLTGDLNVLGDITAANLTATNNVTATNELRAAGGKFRVDGSGLNSTGTAQINGDMNVTGNIVAAQIDGEFIGTLPATVPMTKTNITATSNLRVGSSPSYVFVVDNAGNLTTDGKLTVKGAADIDGNLAVGGTASVAGNTTLGADASVAGDLSVTGTVNGSNIPNVIRAGTATVAGAAEVVTVSGMPATASVVVTPRFAGAAAASADVSAGSFSLDGDSGAYSWIAIW